MGPTVEGPTGEGSELFAVQASRWLPCVARNYGLGAWPMTSRLRLAQLALSPSKLETSASDLYSCAGLYAASDWPLRLRWSVPTAPLAESKQE